MDKDLYDYISSLHVMITCGKSGLISAETTVDHDSLANAI